MVTTRSPKGGLSSFLEKKFYSFTLPIYLIS